MKPKGHPKHNFLDEVGIQVGFIKRKKSTVKKIQMAAV
jgi:hypothetical protein